MLALDVNIDEEGNRHIAVAGWQEEQRCHHQKPDQASSPPGSKHVLCTDIGRDGHSGQYQCRALPGSLCPYPNVPAFGPRGGIGSLADIRRSRAQGSRGSSSVAPCWRPSST